MCGVPPTRQPELARRELLPGLAIGELVEDRVDVPAVRAWPAPEMAVLTLPVDVSPWAGVPVAIGRIVEIERDCRRVCFADRHGRPGWPGV